MKKTDNDIQMLGPRSVMEGNLVFEGTLYLNGQVKGEIESRTGTIVVGEEAVIHADVFVQTATVKGEIKGTVRATERIELYPPARVYGDINAPVVEIEAGAIFEGACTIESKEKATSQANQVQQLTKHGENTKANEIIQKAKGAIPLRQ
jgi:cytoskeletal protein CcmA (bactofilin family)